MAQKETFPLWTEGFEKPVSLFRGRVKTEKQFLVMLCEDAAFLKKGGTRKPLPAFRHDMTAGLYPWKSSGDTDPAIS
ncbi:hypothetical protein [Novacetimonas cocois]|uniref:hypothetical protein n=1 Tax=Novacetimonas cocois TaxID=1747507 RepID=UPI00105821E6|nr:hypothetical protein [Novacetimonas cocois]